MFACSNIVVIFNRSVCQSWQDSAAVKTAVQINQILVSTPFLRSLLSIISPIFVFNDDLMFYVYHNRTYERMIVTTTLFQIMNDINEHRWLPEIVDLSAVQSLYANRFA